MFRVLFILFIKYKQPKFPSAGERTTKCGTSIHRVLLSLQRFAGQAWWHNGLSCHLWPRHPVPQHCFESRLCPFSPSFLPRQVGRQWTMAQVSPYHPHGRVGWCSCLLAPAWPSRSYCGHWRMNQQMEPLFLCLSCSVTLTQTNLENQWIFTGTFDIMDES